MPKRKSQLQSMKYKDYNIEDFLQDEFFITWVMNPNEETSHFWEKWLDKHPEKRNIVAKASSIIQSVDYKEERQLSDDLYMEMYENIMLKDKREDNKVKLINWEFWKNLAAAIFIAGCFYLGYKAVTTEITPNEVTNYQIKRENPAGQKSIINLPDGTVVHLNAESSIEFPNSFSDTLRAVSMTGEAFFDVTEDKNRPFIIKSGENVVKVLGTSFNVRQGKDFSVALVSGKVEVADESGHKIYLEPKEMLIKEKAGKFTKSSFDPLAVIGWKDKYLVFKEDDLQEVAIKIEKWYGVKVNIQKKTGKDWKYSGVYYKENLENVMEGISITSGFKYNIEGKTITIN